MMVPMTTEEMMTFSREQMIQAYMDRMGKVRDTAEVFVTILRGDDPTLSTMVM